MKDHIFVTVYKPSAGWKALLMSDEGPLQTGYFAFETKSEAVKDAKVWAKANNLTFKYYKDDCPKHLIRGAIRYIDSLKKGDK